MRRALLLSTAAVAACSGSAGTDGFAAPAPQGSLEAPSDVVESSPEATPEPKPLPVKVTKRTKSVRRGGTASVTIRTIKGARCDILVEYASGYSEAEGLEPKKANSSGMVTWKWKVGRNTTRGTWPIDVQCELGDRSGGASTTFKVT